MLEAEAIGSEASVDEAVNAVSWAHQLAGLAPVAQAPFVHTALAGLHRQLAKPKHKKEPITTEMLAAIVHATKDTLTDVHFAAIALIAFSAFLRCDQIINIRCCDMVFKSNVMVVNLPKSKTDQFREGASVLVAHTGAHTCPVAMMEHYFLMASLDHSSVDYVFEGLCPLSQENGLGNQGS